MEELRKDWPESINVTCFQDQSEEVETLLADLVANVIAAVLLVMIVIVAALGLRWATPVDLAIPGAFLVGATGANLNFFTREIVFGAPSTHYWTELSSAIVGGGLVVATLLTLVLTPAMLLFGDNRNRQGGGGLHTSACPLRLCLS